MSRGYCVQEYLGHELIVKRTGIGFYNVCDDYNRFGLFCMHAGFSMHTVTAAAHKQAGGKQQAQYGDMLHIATANAVKIQMLSAVVNTTFVVYSVVVAH